jgi:hypothetical protein
MYGFAINKFDKQQIATALVVIAVIILGVFYYFGYIKLPAIVQPVKEKTTQELLNDFKADLTAGKLTNLNGVIVKVDGKVVTLMAGAGGDKKEQNITLADNVVIRRLTMPEIKPGDGLTPMIETFVAAAELRIGDNVFANINKNDAVVVLDVMPASPSNSTTEGAATTTIKTIK